MALACVVSQVRTQVRQERNIDGNIVEDFLASLSRRAAAKLGRAELLANFFGGAVWGVFRENANCGDPPG